MEKNKRLVTKRTGNLSACRNPWRNGVMDAFTHVTNADKSLHSRFEHTSEIHVDEHMVAI